MLKRLSLFAAVLLLVMGLHTSASAYEQGQIVVVGTYCAGEQVDRAFMEKFTGMVAQAGLDGYFEFVSLPDTPCYDMRVNSAVQPVEAVLLEKQYSFKLPTGEVLEIWTVTDQKGNEAYTWLPSEDRQP